ncbi:MAG TPA: hypothetical protein V6D27_00820 [Vampirovibrionales bacterium]
MKSERLHHVRIYFIESQTQLVIDEHPITEIYRESLLIKIESCVRESKPIAELVLEKYPNQAAITNWGWGLHWFGYEENLEIQWYGVTPIPEIKQSFSDLFAELAPEVSVGFDHKKPYKPQLQYSTWEAKARLEGRMGGFGIDPFFAFRGS